MDLVPFAGSQERARGVITGTFEPGYRVAVTTRHQSDASGTVTITPTGPVHRAGPFDEEENSMVEATWLGPCGPDLKPGDILWSDGKTTNLRGRWSAAPDRLVVPASRESVTCA